MFQWQILHSAVSQNPRPFPQGGVKTASLIRRMIAVWQFGAAKSV